MAAPAPTSMEEAISILVDTITSVLLVFEEAASDSKKQVHVGATNQLAHALGVLVGMAQKICSYIDPEFKGQMEKVVTDIQAEQQVIQMHTGKSLTSDQSEQIHGCIKRIMQYSVRMMALNDLHQVRQCTNTGKLVAELLARLSKVDSVDQLMAVGQEAVPLLANLKELFRRRLKIVAHPERLKMLQRSMDVLTTHSVLIIEASRDYLLDTSEEKNQIKIDAFTLLIKAIFEGMDVIEASSQFLQSFDIEFFFPGGGGYRKAIDPRIALRIGELAGLISDALRNLGLATAAGDTNAVLMHAQRVADAMREAIAMAKMLAAEMDDPVKKAALLEAAATLEWIAPELLRVTKELLSDPNNPELLRQHRELMEKANAATAMIKLAADIGALESHFAEMFKAIAKGDEAGALAAAEKIIDNIEEQIMTGRELAEYCQNPVLKQKILDACTILEAQKEKLKPAVVTAVRNPNDQQAKDNLQAIVNTIAAASGDLADAAIVPISAQNLASFADLPMRANAAEREAVERAHAIHDALDRMIDAIKRGDVKVANEAMDDFIEHAREQVDRAREIAQDVSDPALRKDLLNAANNLEERIPQIQAAVATSLAHPKDAEAQIRVRDLVRLAKDESAKISNLAVRAANERIRNLRMPEGANAAEREAADAAHSVFQALDDLWDAVLKGDSRLAHENFERFKQAALKQVSRARELAETCKDPVLKQKLLDAANRLEKQIPFVENALKNALSNPNDPNARQALADAINGAKEVSSEIASLAIQAAQARLQARMPTGANAGELEAAARARSVFQALDSLWDAVLRGDAKMASEAFDRFKDNAQAQAARARDLAASCKDPALSKELLAAADRLDKSIPAVEAAMKQALANPNDAAARAKLADAISNAKDDSSHIAALAVRASEDRLKRAPNGANATEQEAAERALAVFEALDSLWDAVLRGDAKMASEAFGRFKDNAQAQAARARDLAASCKDPALSKELLAAADRLDKSIPAVEAAMKQALANPNDAAARAQLADAVTEAKNASSNIATLAVRASEHRLKREGEVEKVDVMQIDQRVPAHVAKALSDMNDAANQSRFGEDTPQGRLITASRDVAQLLQDFTIAAENLDKVGMIRAARAIVEAIKGVEGFAKNIADSCTNGFLKNSLLNISVAPQNYGQQLKLIASVKSTTQNDIRTAKGQMYNAAKHIADALTETIRSGESAALKSTDTDSRHTNARRFDNVGAPSQLRTTQAGVSQAIRY